MENMMENDEAVSPVIATILMVAITVVLAGVLYVWASDLASNQEELGTLNNLRATDASAQITNGTNDTLVRIDWRSATEDLRWSFVTLSINVGDNVYPCSVGGADDCVIDQTGDVGTDWENDEVIFLRENGVDISGAGPSIDIWLSVGYNGKEIAGGGQINVIQLQ